MRHEVLQDGLTSSHSQFKDYLERFPPFEYSAKNWGYHARMSHSKVKEQVQAFVQSENALSQSLWVLFADRYLRRIKQGCSIRASLLYTAAYFSLGECLLYFLANSVSRDTKDDDGQTALHWAARNGQVEAAELLLKHGLEVYGAGKERKTALHYAADQDDSQLIKLLVQYRANIEYTDIDGQTPLLTAVQNVKLELAQELVRLGASIKAIDSMRRSALHLSTKGGSRSIQITNFLLARGACSEICDVGNMMPLHYAIRKGSKDTAEASIQAGACVNAGIARKRWNRTTKAGRGVYEPSPGDQDAPGSKLVHGLTPLHWAALIGHSEMVRYLLSKGADRTSVARVATHRCTLPYAKISFGITEILGTHPNGGLKFSATWLGLEVKRLNYIEPRTGTHKAKCAKPKGSLNYISHPPQVHFALGSYSQ